MNRLGVPTARALLRCAYGHHARWRPTACPSNLLNNSSSAVPRRFYSNSSNKNYYDILGLSSSASESEIKKSYFKLAKQYHPDVCKDKDASQKFQDVSEAYEVLSDKTKKREYDAFRSGGFRQGFDNRGMGGGGQQGFNFHSTRSPQDIFDELFGKNFRFTDSQYGFADTQELTVRVTFEEAACGVQKSAKINVIDACTTCRGSGVQLGFKKVACPYCNGSGMITQHLSGFYMQSTCQHCHGEGQYNKNPCQDCQGEGRVVQSRSTSFYIPPGIDDEQTLRMQVGSSTVYVRVLVSPSLIHKRVKENIYTDVELGVSDAVLGATVNVPGIGADTTVRIPPGTSSHSAMCLKGKGLKRLNNVGSGDQYLNIKIRVPKNLTADQKRLMAEWRLLETPQSGDDTRARDDQRCAGTQQNAQRAADAQQAADAQRAADAQQAADAHQKQQHERQTPHAQQQDEQKEAEVSTATDQAAPEKQRDVAGSSSH